MHTFRYPIIIDGNGYYVEKTFCGSPAVYKGVEFTHRGHISEPGLAIHNTFPVTEPDAVIIIARRTTDLVEPK